MGTLTPALLSEIGQALHGERWQVPLSRDVEVNERTMRRWAAGQNAIPDALAGELLAKVSKRRIELEAMVRQLKSLRES